MLYIIFKCQMKLSITFSNLLTMLYIKKKKKLSSQITLQIKIFSSNMIKFEKIKIHYITSTTTVLSYYR